MFIRTFLLYLLVSFVQSGVISSNKRCLPSSNKRCLSPSHGEASEKHQRSAFPPLVPFIPPTSRGEGSGRQERSPFPPLVPLIPPTSRGEGSVRQEQSHFPPLVPLVPTDDDLRDLQRRLPPLVPLVPTNERRSRPQRALPPLVPPRARLQYRGLSSLGSFDESLSERTRALPPLVPSRGQRVARQEFLLPLVPPRDQNVARQGFLPPLVPPKFHGDDMSRRSTVDTEEGVPRSFSLSRRSRSELLADVLRVVREEEEEEERALNEGLNLEEKDERLVDTNEEEERFGEMRNREERGRGEQHAARHISSSSSSKTGHDGLVKPEAHSVLISEEPNYEDY